MTEKKEHPNAMLLRWIADGEVIESTHITDDSWTIRSVSGLLSDIAQNKSNKKYRIKLKTIRIGKYDVVEPMKEMLADGTTYFWLDGREPSGVEAYTWYSDATDSALLANGYFWLKEEDALLAAKAIKELLTGQ